MTPEDTNKNTNDADVIDAAMKLAVENVRALAVGINSSMQQSNEAEPWFGNILVGILNCALLDFYSLEVGRNKSVFLMAWGRRNLLELKVITEYVLSSRANAESFKNELAIDAKEFYEALSKVGHASHKRLLTTLAEAAAEETGDHKEFLEQAHQLQSQRGSGTDATDAEAKIFAEMMARFGIEGKRPLMASQIAKKVQLQEDFDPMFKICSKIMHRTVLSIASSTTEGALDEVVPLLFNSGSFDLLGISQSIHDYFAQNGTRPPLT
jgi:hypothetical protein